MAGLTDARIDDALARGVVARTHEPRAASVRYDGSSGKVIVALTSGCTFAFPAKLAQGLEAATEAQLSEVQILGAGTAPRADDPAAPPGLLRRKARKHFFFEKKKQKTFDHELHGQ